jgi:hypothetical protein
VTAVCLGRTSLQFGVRHITTLHAFAPTEATVVESRIVVDAHTDGQLQIALREPDATLERAGPGPALLTLDADGIPALVTEVRLGSSYRFDAEFRGPTSPVRVRRDGVVTSIENLSSHSLTSCMLPPAFGDAGAVLEPGASFTTTAATAEGDTVTCRLNAPLLQLTGPGLGTPAPIATLVVHLDRATQ